MKAKRKPAAAPRVPNLLSIHVAQYRVTVLVTWGTSMPDLVAFGRRHAD